jgi:predicted phosphodiesterase
VSFDEAIATFRAGIGQAELPASSPDSSTSRRKKIVVGSDFHCPFHDPAVIGRMIADTRGADLFVANGDIDDGYQFSSFVKQNRMTFNDSIAATTALLKVLSESFVRVLAVTGNHDHPRLERTLRKQLPPDFIDAIKYLAGGSLNYIAAAGRQFDNVKFVARQVEDVGQVHWFTQVGDVLITHAEKFSKVPGKAACDTADWLMRREKMLGLKPWSILIQGHTHQQAMVPYRDKLVIEGGALCKTQAYQLDPKLWGLTQMQGYVTFEQEAGVTDPRSINLVRL